MNSKFLLAFLVAGAVAGAAEDGSSLQTLQDAIKFRTELASAVATKVESPEEALGKLRSQRSVKGASLPSEADFGAAAMEVGHRLLALDRAAAAEIFFRAAETSFVQAVNTAKPEESGEKARNLEKLAMIRSRYLGKIAEAKANIDEAIRLQPEDQSLVATRSLVARGQGAAFQPEAKK